MYISHIIGNLSKQLLQRIKIVSVGSHELLSELQAGKIDIAMLGSIAPIDQTGIFAELITARPFSIIVSADHPLAKKKAVSFQDLTNEIFINYDQQYVHKAAFQAYSTYAQINPQTAIYKVPNVSWIKELVRQNKGISLMVKDAVKDEPGIVALDIKDPIPEKFFISLATREDYILSDDEQQLITKLKAITPVA